MMRYRLKISNEVQRQIARLPGNIRQRIRQAIAGLAYNPRPPQAKQMEDDLAAYYRLRLENYRVIYAIDDDVVLISVVPVTMRTPKTYDDL